VSAKRIEILLSAAGLALFATVVSKIGWSAALHELRRAWVALPLLIGLSLVRLFLQTRSWQLALREEGAPTEFGELVGIRLASQSLGYLSVLGPAVSEPMKIKLLGSNWKTSLTATLVDSGTYWLSSVMVGIIGCVAAAVILAHGRYSATVLAIATLFVLAAAVLFRAKPILSSLVGLSGRRAPQWLKKGAELEGQIRTFRERHPGALRSMMRLGLVCQVLLVAEAAIVISAAKLPVHLFTILGIEAAVRFAKMTGGWIPARIGADEGGAVAAFTAFGLSPAAGLMLALARRSRDLLWCVLGLGWLAWRSQQIKKERILADGCFTCR
jgi:hypothetical protein